MKERKSGIPKESERIVNGRVFKVIEIPPEDPQQVMKRDRVRRDYVGDRPMVDRSFTDPNTGITSHARRAIKAGPTISGREPRW